jgi:nondiscriminating aspartyl-tRNA synthetase
MAAKRNQRIFIQSVPEHLQEEVILRGWVSRLRVLGKTTFVIVKDCSGEAQCVAASDAIRELRLKAEDVIEVHGRARRDERAKTGCEVDVLDLRLLNRSAQNLPFHASADLESVGYEALLEYRPLALRNQSIGDVFRIQAALLKYFREYLAGQQFTEILTSKIVASGTEGGTNLFELKYFDRVAYLAQSPQFYKEHAVAGLERVFETGHVYRAEPHATSRHLTEYYSLDVEFGFIDGPEDVMQLERELLDSIFARLNENFAAVLHAHKVAPLPRMLDVPCWEFAECLELLKEHFHRTELTDDLDPEAERQLSRKLERPMSSSSDSRSPRALSTLPREAAAEPQIALTCSLQG